MKWNWAAFGVGVGVASLLWAIGWGIYTRKTEPQQAVRTTKEIERTKRESERLLVIRSHAIGVVQMADNLLATHQSSPTQVSIGQVQIKMSGRLKGLRESWLKYERDIHTRALVRSYERLRMDDTLAWFESRSAEGGVGKATIEEAMNRVEEARDLADDVRASAEEAGA